MFQWLEGQEAKGISRGETECISGTGWPKCTDEGRRANDTHFAWGFAVP